MAWMTHKFDILGTGAGHAVVVQLAGDSDYFVIDTSAGGTLTSSLDGTNFSAIRDTVYADKSGVTGSNDPIRLPSYPYIRFVPGNIGILRIGERVRDSA